MLKTCLKKELIHTESINSCPNKKQIHFTHKLLKNHKTLNYQLKIKQTSAL